MTAAPPSWPDMPLSDCCPLPPCYLQVGAEVAVALASILDPAARAGRGASPAGRGLKEMGGSGTLPSKL